MTNYLSDDSIEALMKHETKNRKRKKKKKKEGNLTKEMLDATK